MVWFWKGDELINYDGQGWSRRMKLPDEIEDTPPVIPPELEGTKEAQKIAFHYRIRYKIRNAIQDRDGYIWLGTVSTVIRFDERRQEWKKIPQITEHPTVLIYPAILIYEDRVGRIWIADRENVLAYDKSNDSSAAYELPAHISRPQRRELSIHLNAMYQDKQGRMLFALDRGLLCYTGAEGKWELFTLKGIGLDNSVDSIMEDRHGRIWLTTRSGIAVLEE